MASTIPIILILTGFLLVIVAGALSVTLGDLSRASLILAPALVYLLSTGSISEFEGLGWKAKFSDIANNRIIDTAQAADLLISDEESNNPNFLKDMFTKKCRPYYVVSDDLISTALDGNDRKIVIEAANSIRNSILCGEFHALVIVDAGFKPIGVVEREAIQEFLRIKLFARNGNKVDDIEKISRNVFSEIIITELGFTLTNPNFQARRGIAKQVFINSDLGLSETYQKLISENARVAAIVSRLGYFEGIITKEAIEEQFLIGLLSE